MIERTEVKEFELLKENTCCDCEGLAMMEFSDCDTYCTAFEVAKRMMELGLDEKWDGNIPAESREADRALALLNKTPVCDVVPCGEDAKWKCFGGKMKWRPTYSTDAKPYPENFEFRCGAHQHTLSPQWGRPWVWYPLNWRFKHLFGLRELPLEREK